MRQQQERQVQPPSPAHEGVPPYSLRPLGGKPAAPVRRTGDSGQTLMEVVVAVFIAGMLALLMMTGMSLTLIRGRGKLSTVRRNRDVLVSDLRAQQQGSLVGKTVSVCTTGTVKKICPTDGSCACADEVPRGGYGAYLARCVSAASPCAYYLFADLDGDATYDSYASTNETLPGGSKRLEQGVTVPTLQPIYQGCSNGSDAYFTVTFTPYTGSATLRGSSSCPSYPDSPRLRETVQFGPSSVGVVQLGVYRGGGGIHETTVGTAAPTPSP